MRRQVGKLVGAVVLLLFLVLDSCPFNPPNAYAQPPSRWSAPIIVSTGALPSPGATQFPYVLSSPDGAVHILWMEKVDFKSQGLGDTFYYLRRDGLTRSAPIDIRSSGGAQTISFPNIIGGYLGNSASNVAFAADGKAYMLWQGNLGDRLFTSWAPLASMGIAGKWSQPQVAMDGSNIAGTMVVDQKGSLHLIYYTRDEGLGIYYIRSDDGGSRWTRPVDVSGGVNERGTEAGGGSIAVDADETIHVTWTLHTSTAYTKVGYPSRAYYVRSTDGGKSFSIPLSLDAAEGTSFVADTPKVALTGPGQVHLIWMGDALRRHQWSADGGKTWSSAEPIMGSVWGHSGNGMAVDSVGNLHVVSAGHTNTLLNESIFYSSWNATTKSWSPLEVIADSSILAPFSAAGFEAPQIAVNEGNRLHVVWQDRDNIWYSSKYVDAPAVPRVPIPTLSPTTTLTPTETIVPESTATLTPTRTSFSQPSDSNSTAYLPLEGIPVMFWSLLPAALFVGLIVLGQVWRRR